MALRYNEQRGTYRILLRLTPHPFSQPTVIPDKMSPKTDEMPVTGLLLRYTIRRLYLLFSFCTVAAILVLYVQSHTSTTPTRPAATPRSGHAPPDTVHTSPRSGHAPPDTGHTSPRSGHAPPDTVHTSPRSGHAPPDTVHTSPRSGHAPPDTVHTSPRSGHAPPDTVHTSTRSGHAPSDTVYTSPRSGHAHRTLCTPAPGQDTPHRILCTPLSFTPRTSRRALAETAVARPSLVLPTSLSPLTTPHKPFPGTLHLAPHLSCQ